MNLAFVAGSASLPVGHPRIDRTVLNAAVHGSIGIVAHALVAFRSHCSLRCRPLALEMFREFLAALTARQGVELVCYFLFACGSLSHCNHGSFSLVFELVFHALNGRSMSLSSSLSSAIRALFAISGKVNPLSFR